MELSKRRTKKIKKITCSVQMKLSKQKFKKITPSVSMKLSKRKTKKIKKITNLEEECEKIKKLTNLEEGWKMILQGITKLEAILEDKDSTPLSWEEKMGLYTLVHDMSVQKTKIHESCVAEQLYNRYKDYLFDYINRMVLPPLGEKHSTLFLEVLVKRWSNYKILLKWLYKFFQYLNRFYIPRHRLPTLNEVGLTVFRNEVYKAKKGRAIYMIISLINQERLGEFIDRSLVKKAVDVILDQVNSENEYIYMDDFEAPMLENTAAYYSQMASNHIMVDSCPDYLLMKTLHELLLHGKQLLEKEQSGLHIMLRDGQVENLARMFRLFSRVTGELDAVAVVFKEQMTADAITLVKEAEDAASCKKVETKDIVGSHQQVLVRKLIELHDKYYSYVSDCFSGHVVFHKAFREIFEVVFNKQVAGISGAEMLASFSDNTLKKSGRSEKLSDEAVEETLEKITMAVCYLHEKDLFAEFYRKKLARRLLSDRSMNDEHERSLLSKFKGQFGAQLTSKMEGMVTDLSLSRDRQVEFQKYLVHNLHKNQGTDMSVIILTTGFWPTYNMSDFNAPAELISCIQVFNKFYGSKTKHRKLTWLFSLSNCNVIGRFDFKTIEMQLSTYQAATLLLFNTSKWLSFSEIVLQLKLPIEEMIKIMHSLSCSKYKILIKEPNTKTILQTDSFEFNSKFTDKMNRIKVPLPHVEVKNKIFEDVDKDRRYTIDAAIVRIVKARKVLGHQNLVIECVQMLNQIFKPDVKIIKQRIGDLIQRDYIERDVEDLNLYRYKA